MILPSDVSRCTGEGCPQKHGCLRFTDRPKGEVYLSEFCPKSCIVKIEDGDSLELKYKMIIKG